MQRGRGKKGYIYYRDRSNGDDVTVYEQQLMSLISNDPHDVFDPDIEVHHLTPIRDLNVPWLLDLVDSEEHRSRPRDRAQLRERFPLENGDEAVFVTVEADGGGIVEELAAPIE